MYLDVIGRNLLKKLYHERKWRCVGEAQYFNIVTYCKPAISACVQTSDPYDNDGNEMGFNMID
jgi:hypothetical protein